MSLSHFQFLIKGYRPLGSALISFLFESFNSSLKDTRIVITSYSPWVFNFQFLIKGYERCNPSRSLEKTFNSSLKDTRYWVAGRQGRKTFNSSLKDTCLSSPVQTANHSFQFLIKGYPSSPSQ